MKKRKKVIVIIAAAFLAVLGAGFGLVSYAMPYEITADGETLVVVKNQSTAEKVVKIVLNSYVDEDANITSVKTDKTLKVSKVSVTDIFNVKDDVVSKDEAVEYLTEANADGDSLFDATIISQVVEEEEYTPEITYKADDTALAGTKTVEKEGSDGVKNVTYEVTTVNGEETAKEAVDEEIVEEGESSVVVKGTLGVPEGEDWETYEGNPVYNDGSDIATTSLQYLGSPYKYGGYSFTKGIDCVQYVRNIYRMYGVELPNNHPGLQKVGSGVSLSNAKPGDIICYNHHVAIYLGNGKMSEATRKKGTTVNKVRSGYKTIRHVNTGN